MIDPLIRLDLQNDRALARAEAASLIPPEERPRSPFAPPLDEEESEELRDRGQG